MDFAWRFAVLDLLPDFVQQQVPENLSPDTLQKLGLGAILLALLWGFVDWPVVLSLLWRYWMLAAIAVAVYRLAVPSTPLPPTPLPPTPLSPTPLPPTPPVPGGQRPGETKMITPARPATQATICWCCTDLKPGSEFGLPSKQCAHENDTCKACLWSTVEKCHLAYNAVDIRCPYPNCKQPMETNDMIALYGVKSKEFLQFSDVNTLVSIQQELFRCAYGCESKGQLVEGGADTFSWLTCVGCARKTCFVCKVQHHEGLSCSEFQEELKNQAMTQAAAEAWDASIAAGFEIKVCPGRCGKNVTRFIEDKKTECPIMRCCGKGGDHECKREGEQCDHKSASGESFCGYRFCWECLQKVEENGDCEHLSDCPKHLGKLVKDATIEELRLMEELANQP